MPTLKRRHGQVVLIGADISVEVVLIERGAVILRVTAPPELKIRRCDSAEPAAEVSANSEKSVVPNQATTAKGGAR